MPNLSLMSQFSEFFVGSKVHEKLNQFNAATSLHNYKFTINGKTKVTLRVFSKTMFKQRATLCLLTTGAIGIYIVLTIYLFNRFPSLNQIWIEINDGISLIKDHKIDYSMEVQEIQMQKFDIIDTNNSITNELSSEILSPWIHVQSRLQHRKKLRNKTGKGKFSPWTRRCPPNTQMKTHHDSLLNHNIFTPPQHYVNFTELKLMFNAILSKQEELTVLPSDSDNDPTQCSYKSKVFGIGLFKTGTTSLSLALKFLGFQDNAKTSVYKWLRQYPCNYGHWYLILRHYYDLMLSLLRINNGEIYYDILKRSLKSYNFGDFPILYFWQFFDIWYSSNSKFILTKRGSTQKFVNSQMMFCLQLKECMQFKIKRDGNYDANINLQQYKWNESDDINGEDLANYIAMIYELHNQRIIQYFKEKNKMSNLLILNVDDTDDKTKWIKIMDFLGCKNDTIIKYALYPHVNPTKKDHIPFKSLLNDSYELNWKKYFKNKIPIMRTRSVPNRRIWFEYQDGDYADLI